MVPQGLTFKTVSERPLEAAEDLAAPGREVAQDVQGYRSAGTVHPHENAGGVGGS